MYKDNRSTRNNYSLGENYWRNWHTVVLGWSQRYFLSDRNSAGRYLFNPVYQFIWYTCSIKLQIGLRETYIASLPDITMINQQFLHKLELIPLFVSVFSDEMTGLCRNVMYVFLEEFYGIEIDMYERASIAARTYALHHPVSKIHVRYF